MRPTLMTVLTRLYHAEAENKTLLDTIIERESAIESLEHEANRLSNALAVATDLLTRSTVLYDELKAEKS